MNSPAELDFNRLSGFFLGGKKMAPEVGLEPTTNRLTADRSTTELLRNQKTSARYKPFDPVFSSGILTFSRQGADEQMGLRCCWRNIHPASTGWNQEKLGGGEGATATGYGVIQRDG